MAPTTDAPAIALELVVVELGGGRSHLDSTQALWRALRPRRPVWAPSRTQTSQDGGRAARGVSRGVRCGSVRG